MKKCVLYDGKICNDCGECNRCDLDPNKICDNCGKCLQKGDDEFNSIIYRYPTEAEAEEDNAQHECGCGHCEEDSDFDSTELEAFEAFLDEPVELDIPDPIEIDPALAAEWERRLAESFREDARREAASEDAPKGLYAVRKRRDRKS